MTTKTTTIGIELFRRQIAQGEQWIKGIIQADGSPMPSFEDFMSLSEEERNKFIYLSIMSYCESAARTDIHLDTLREGMLYHQQVLENLTNLNPDKDERKTVQ